MYTAIIKHKLRAAKGLLKHFGITTIGLLIVVCYVAAQFYIIVLNGGIGTALPEKYIFYFLVACAALSGFRVLIKNPPIITMNAATLHYLYFTKHFKRIMVIKYLWSFIRSLLFAAILSGFISGFQANAIFGRYLLLLCGYLFLGVLLSWSRYHSMKGKSQLTVIVCYILSSVCLLTESGVISMILNYCLVLCWICYVVFRLPLNLTKYRKDLAFIDENNSAASQYNMVKMSQMAAESEAKKKRSLFLYHFPLKKKNVVFYKCLIELIRTGNRIWGIFICLLLTGFLFYRTPAFSLIPILGEVDTLASAFSVLVVMMVYRNVGEIIKKQAGALLTKHKQGLFIPMEKRQIILSYLAVSILIFAVITVCAGFIFGSKVHFVLLFFALFIAVFTVEFILALTESKLSKITNQAMPMLSIVLGSIFLI